MNRDELEQWMKDSLEKQEFVPSEASWERLRIAMDKPAKKDRRKALILLLSHKRFRAAAAVALMATTGGLLYHTLPRTEQHTTPHTITALRPAAQYKAAQPLQAMPAPAPTISPVAQSAHRSLQQHRPFSAPATPAAREHILTNTTPDPVPVASFPDSAAPKQIPDMRSFVQAQPAAGPRSLWQDDTRNADDPAAFTLGVAAQLGKVNVGNARYQLGLVAHQRLTGKLYAEATIAVASTAVSYVERSEYPAITANTGTAGTANTVSSKPVDAQYGNNVYAAGITPALGYHITRKVALSCGFSLYRNLNPSVSLKDEATIDPAVVSNNLVQEKQTLGNWDAGVTGNVAYTAGKRLTFQIQYRQGLSTYMYINRQAMRNSGMNVGLNYVFHD